MEQQLPKNKKYEPLLKLIKSYTPHFYDCFNDTDRKNIASCETEKLPIDIQDDLVSRATKDKVLQVALIKSSLIDEKHLEQLCHNFLYKEARLEALKSPYISKISNSDYYIKKMLETVTPKSLSDLFRTEPNHINQDVIKYIVKDVLSKIEETGKCPELEEYQLKAFSIYKNPVINSRVFHTISKHNIPEDLRSALINNENISAHNRQVLTSGGYNPETI